MSSMLFFNQGPKHTISQVCKCRLWFLKWESGLVKTYIPLYTLFYLIAFINVCLLPSEHVTGCPLSGGMDPFQRLCTRSPEMKITGAVVLRPPGIQDNSKSPEMCFFLVIRRFGRH